MSQLIEVLPEIMVFLSVAAVFAIVFVTVLKILRGVSFFQGTTAVIMAVSISLLFILALSQFLVVPAQAYNSAEANKEITVTVSYLRLHYFALAVAVAVLLSQILLLANKTSPDKKPEALAKKPERPVAKSKSPGRPKKAKSAEEESKEVSKPVGSAS